MLRNSVLLFAVWSLASTGIASDDLLAELNAEAEKVEDASQVQRGNNLRKIILAAPAAASGVQISRSALIGKRARKVGLSISGFSEMLQYRNAGTYELFTQLSPLDRQAVLDAYNSGAGIDDIRPLIVSLYQ